MYILTLQDTALEYEGIVTTQDPDDTVMLLGTIPKMLAYGWIKLSDVMAAFVNVKVVEELVLRVFVCSMYFVPSISV